MCECPLEHDNSPGATPSKKTHSPVPATTCQVLNKPRKLCAAYLTHWSSSWPPDSSSEHLLQGPGLGPPQHISPNPFPKLFQPLNFVSLPPASFSYINLPFQPCVLCPPVLSHFFVCLPFIWPLSSPPLLLYLFSWLCSVQTFLDASGFNLPHIYNKILIFQPQLGVVISSLPFTVNCQ